MSGRVRICRFLAGGVWAATATANPATIEYDCAPSLPIRQAADGRFQFRRPVDHGHLSEWHLTRMTKAMSASGVRYVGGKVEIFDRGARPLVLNVDGQPSRECVRAALS